MVAVSVDAAAVAEPSVVSVVVVGVVAIVVLAPMLALCGDCFGDDTAKPGPGPGNGQGSPHRYNQNGGYNASNDPRYQQYQQQQYQQYQQYQHGQQYSQQQYQQAQHDPRYQQQQQQYYQQQYYQQQQRQQEQYHQQQRYQQQDPRYQQQHHHHHQHGQQQYQQHSQQHYQQHAPSHAPAAPSELKAADDSLQAVADLLRQVGKHMDGEISSQRKIIPETIRIGAAAVVADVRTSYARTETALFFPGKKQYGRQHSLHEHAHFKDNLALMQSCSDVSTHEKGGVRVYVPAAIFLSQATPLKDRLSKMQGPEKQSELTNIWNQLSRILKAFHNRRWYVRDLTESNLVHVRMGGSEGWTLLEFGNAGATKNAVVKSTLPARQVPPELAAKMLDPNVDKVMLGTLDKAVGAYDMWVLGTLVYEVMAGEPYWNKSLSDKQILETMADPKRKLPHEERPLAWAVVHGIMEQLLQRDPLERITSADLQRKLETEVGTVGATINAGPIVSQPDLVLEGA